MKLTTFLASLLVLFVQCILQMQAVADDSTVTVPAGTKITLELDMNFPFHAPPGTDPEYWFVVSKDVDVGAYRVIPEGQMVSGQLVSYAAATDTQSGTLVIGIPIVSTLNGTNIPVEVENSSEGQVKLVYALSGPIPNQEFNVVSTQDVAVSTSILDTVAQSGIQQSSPQPTQMPATHKAPDPVAARLYNDPAYFACRSGSPNTSNSNGSLAVFTCVYIIKDYKAAEITGEALLLSGASVNQTTMYQIANAFYLRGNSSKALQYAKIAYNRVDAMDRAKCNSNANSCADLRALLAKLDSSLRRQFAAEDALAKAQADAAARQAQAAANESARAAAATVLDISGNGIHSTEMISVNSEWEIDWSYDCSNFSDGTGNFAVSVDGDVSTVAVNQLGGGDSGTEYMHQGGNVYLEINSECSWTVKVVNE